MLKQLIYSFTILQILKLMHSYVICEMRKMIWDIRFYHFYILSKFYQLFYLYPLKTNYTTIIFTTLWFSGFNLILPSAPSLNPCYAQLTTNSAIETLCHGITQTDCYLGGGIFHALIYIIGTKKIFICENTTGRPDILLLFIFMQLQSLQGWIITE